MVGSYTVELVVDPTRGWEEKAYGAVVDVGVSDGGNPDGRDRSRNGSVLDGSGDGGDR